ncbi:MAG TPA: hypothetical protein VF063_04570 [Gaiellaceae bacterium]
MKKLISIAILAALCAAPAAAAPSTLTLKAAPTVVVYGGSTTLSGVLSTQKSGQRVDIQGQECGQTAFKKVTTVTTTTGGAFTFAAKPSIKTSYQAKQKNVTSPAVSVGTTPVLSLKKLAKNKFSVSVTAAQTFVGKFTVFQRFRVRSSKWVSLKHVTLTTLAQGTKPTEVSSATFTIKLPTKLKIRAVLPAAQATTCYLPTKSKVIRS